MKPILLLLALAGCGSKGGTSMAESWQLDRVRLLGVRSEVAGADDPVLGTRAEPRPGETVSFKSLTYNPSDDTELGSIWIACLSDGADAYGCDQDEDAFSALDELDEDSTLEEFTEAIESARAAGVIGLPPLFQPEWTIPADVLDALSESERLEGLSAFISVSLTEQSFDDERDSGDEAAMEPDDIEMGFKRMPVSEAPTPNHNPDVVDFIVAGVRLNGSAGFTARRGYTYVIEPVVPVDHIETYAYLNSDGEQEYRKEEPFFTWYTEPGATGQEKHAQFDQPLSLIPAIAVEWTAPKEVSTILLYVVVRDRRGGMGWRSLKVNVL